MLLTLKHCLAIGIAGFIGALARFFISHAANRWCTTAFPVGTLFINLSGSFILGWFMTVAGNRWHVSDTLRLAVAVGFVGSYTTFSTWMYESTALMELRQTSKACLYLLGSVALGLAAVQLGVWCARRF